MAVALGRPVRLGGCVCVTPCLCPLLPTATLVAVGKHMLEVKAHSSLSLLGRDSPGSLDPRALERNEEIISRDGPHTEYRTFWNARGRSTRQGAGPWPGTRGLGALACVRFPPRQHVDLCVPVPCAVPGVWETHGNTRRMTATTEEMLPRRKAQLCPPCARDAQPAAPLAPEFCLLPMGKRLAHPRDRDGGQRRAGKSEARDRRRESPFGPRACGVRPASIPVPGHQETDSPPATYLKLEVCPFDPLSCPPASLRLRPWRPPAVLGIGARFVSFCCLFPWFILCMEVTSFSVQLTSLT